MGVKKTYLQEKLMQKFGFEEVEGSKHEALSLVVRGKKIATTRFSRGHDVISDSIQNRMAVQISAPTLHYFKQMYGCTKSRDDYLMHLREIGKLKDKD